MIICKACGADNELGHVFCTSCGKKLDLSNLSSSTVGAMQKESWLRRHWPKLVAAAVVALLLPVTLSLWPRTELIGEPGRPVGRSRVRDGIEALRHGGSAQVRSLEVPFSERDINGYFAYGKAEQMQLEAVSVAIHDGAFQIRIIRRLAAVNLGFVTWVPQLSYDLVLVPVGSDLRPARVTMGRLRLFGPARRSVIRNLWQRFAAQREWELLRAASEVRAERDQLVVAVSKP